MSCSAPSLTCKATGWSFLLLLNFPRTFFKVACKKIQKGCFHTAKRVDEPLGSQPQGRLALTPQTDYACALQRSYLRLSWTVNTAVAHVTALVRLCVTPVAQPQRSGQATGREIQCSATVSVAQPPRVLSDPVDWLSHATACPATDYPVWKQPNIPLVIEGAEIA